tara:strand:- start:23 stop:559 length:537 start_codon:yes stop_codon:yes gene_type:complete
MAQRNGIAFAVFDAGLDDVENWQVTVRSRVPPFIASTVEQLAIKIGVDPKTMANTVQTYNESCPKLGEFNPLLPDGLTTLSHYPTKSNWARPLVRPPFRAWPIICSNCFTFGGVKVDECARVVNTEGNIIPGLYAAGEAVGLYYRVYTGATSVMRGAVTGRLAGSDATCGNNDACCPK